jgi:hypothetical protein
MDSLGENLFARKTEDLIAEEPGSRFAEEETLKEMLMAEESGRDAFSSLVHGILLYVVKHPDAKDTVDGISEFWLSDPPVHHSRRRVYEALEYLCDNKCWLRKSKTGAGVTLYALNKPRLPEINRFLGNVAERN